MKIIIKLYFAENSCAVKAANKTSLAITASLPAPEGKVLILNNLLLQEYIDSPTVLPHCFSSLLSFWLLADTTGHLGFPFASTKNNTNEISNSFHS